MPSILDKYRGITADVVSRGYLHPTFHVYLAHVEPQSCRFRQRAAFSHAYVRTLECNTIGWIADLMTPSYIVSLRYRCYWLRIRLLLVGKHPWIGRIQQRVRRAGSPVTNRWYYAHAVDDTDERRYWSRSCRLGHRRNGMSLSATRDYHRRSADRSCSQGASYFNERFGRKFVIVVLVAGVGLVGTLIQALSVIPASYWM